jgi:tripartite-type tricarboxylate transporter receptor subunit TctC
MTFPRRYCLQLIVVAVSATVLSHGAIAEARAFPSIRMIVPCPVGSPADLSARSIAQWWSENSDRRYHVENQPVRTASVGIGAVVETLDERNSFFFDPGDCDNQASVE